MADHSLPTSNVVKCSWSKAAVASCIGVRIPEEDVELDPEALIQFLAYLLRTPQHQKASDFIRTRMHLELDLPSGSPVKQIVSSLPVESSAAATTVTATAPHPSPIVAVTTAQTHWASNTTLNYYQRAYIEACEQQTTELPRSEWPPTHAMGDQHNNKGSEGAPRKGLTPNKTVLNMLSKAETLQVVDISHNLLGNHGVCALLRSLRSAPAILKLILKNNRIQIEAVRELLALINANPRITAIDLSVNPLLAADSGIALLEGLRQFPQLRVVDIHETAVPAYIVDHITARLYHNASLNLPAV